MQRIHACIRMMAIVLAMALPVAGVARSQMTAEDAEARFNRFVADYRDGLCQFDPAYATWLGVHRYDRLLARFDRASIAAQGAWLRAGLAELAAIDSEVLSADARLDKRFLAGDIEDRLLVLEQWRPWKRDPQIYLTAATEALHTLIIRDFGPLADRMQSATQRLAQIPALLESGRINIATAPEPWIRIAKSQFADTLTFVRQSVPNAFASIKEPKLQKPFSEARDQAVAALQVYGRWLDTLKSTPDGFATGSALLAKRVKAREAIDTTPERLEKHGWDELSRLRKLFEATAKRIDPKKSAREVYRTLAADHPKREALLKEVEDGLEAVRAFVVTNRIATLPSERRVRVSETPPFMRATSFASMDTPGPLERVATDAFYHVTLPDSAWPPEKQDEHLNAFSRASLVGTAVHEAYPGHFTHFLYQDRWRPARQLIYSTGMAEGWAHYTEEIAAELGLGGDNVKLETYAWAMIRAARTVAAVGLHAQGWTVAHAQKLFEDEAFVDPVSAEREALRGTSDPLYLMYTIGKLQMQKLRADQENRPGVRFSLTAFHDDILAAGPIPFALHRERLGVPGTTLAR